jgi:hypothetical protein
MFIALYLLRDSETFPCLVPKIYQTIPIRTVQVIIFAVPPSDLNEISISAHILPCFKNIFEGESSSDSDTVRYIITKLLHSVFNARREQESQYRRSR